MLTDISLCVGCNKCIFRCPTHANNAMQIDNKNKISVTEELCIYCAECVIVCDHKARLSRDDTALFFADIARGKPISIITAPSILHNIPEYKRLFGYLKSLGVRFFYDVSFGADITTWGYLRAMEQYSIQTMIAQPCPVIVSYIENFKPELIQYLSPIHSPAVCTSIYMKKYMGVQDSVAFLSPCIAKGVEFSDPNTGGNISYNVTFVKLLKYLEDNNIDLSQYDEVSFDNINGSMGFTFSRPGGLKECVRHYKGESAWIKQVEGIGHVKRYLDTYAQRVKNGKPVPHLVDVLNCMNGCNLGTATTKELDVDDIDYNTNSMKLKVDYDASLKLFEHFDETLELTYFRRGYTARGHIYKTATEEQLEEAFCSMNKFTEADRSVNCFSCGFGNCRDFANAVALGQNHVNNCFQFARSRLDEQAKELQKKNEDIISSLNYAGKIQRSSLPRAKVLRDAFSDFCIKWRPKDIVGGDIYWLRVFDDGVLLCVIDCTGHGTPGALLTMLVTSSLEFAVKTVDYHSPAKIIEELDKRIIRALNVRKDDNSKKWGKIEINDGADLALMFIPKFDDDILLSVIGGVRVFVSDGKEVQQIKGQRLHIGDRSLTGADDVKVIKVPKDKNSKYFISSDGIFDQIGGEKNMAFGYRRVVNIIAENHNCSLDDIQKELWSEFKEYSKDEERRDDVTFFGFSL